MDGGGGGRRAGSVRICFTSDRATKNGPEDAPFSSSLYGHSPTKWAVLRRPFSGLEQSAELLRHLGGGGGTKKKTTAREKQQTAHQRSNLMCADLAFQPINRRGTLNWYTPDGRRAEWPTQGISAPPGKPVVSLRFPSFLLVCRRFSGVPRQICVERRLWATAVLQSRYDPGTNISETGTTT